jgi:indolepyruvate ferredoxin oxidoreductase
VELGPWANLPAPALPEMKEPYGILVTGVGGTGVVTIGALLGMAAHIEGKGCSVLDMAGLAQKGGAVVSHVRISARPEDIHAVRLSAGGAKLVLGCDLVVAGSFDALSKIQQGKSRAVINAHETITGDFTRNPDLAFPMRELREAIADSTGLGNADFLDATRLATALLGDSIATNLFMVGFAWQKGLIPLSIEAIDRAIELNGVAVAANKKAMLWGRRAAHDLQAVEALAKPRQEPPSLHLSATLNEMIERRAAFLTDYQDAAYAARYRGLVERVRAAEAERAPGRAGLAEAVARYYFKLLAYKDEYEVARLYTNGEFLAKLRQQFEGDVRLRFHMAPPLLSHRDPDTGHLTKREFGGWLFHAFKLVAMLRRLRGTPLDIFGYSAERRLERRLIADYEALIGKVLAGLTAGSHRLAVDLASVPELIRGFGHVKEQHLAQAKTHQAQLLALYHRDPPAHRSAAE